MERLHILQITDCHLFPQRAATLLGVCVYDALCAVLRTACAERAPDAVLATGDLAQRPSSATYALFLAAVREHFEGPLLCVPGNHDHGEVFRAVLPTADLALGPWRLLGVDTHLDDVVAGTVAEGELARLAAALEEGDGPALVAGHHSPVPIGCPWLDEHRIDNGDALLEVLAGAAAGPGARAYVFGHIHQPFERLLGNSDGGMPVLGTPSTCFAFAGQSPTFAVGQAKPGYRWLTLDAGGGVETRVGRAADYHLRIDLTDRDHP